MRILIVEDDFASRKFMMNFMSAYGDCDGTVDGMEAVEAYMMALEDKQPYDLICLDVMMPVMDGYQATNVIRSCERADAKTIPIIAMTAKAFDDDRKQSKEAGMNAHISKPIEIPNLLNTIDGLCNNATKLTGVTL